jgi:hypothetical protein
VQVSAAEFRLGSVDVGMVPLRVDEEGRGIRRANVVQVAGDAERFGGPLPASLT